jgi:hypothetical protein
VVVVVEASIPQVELIAKFIEKDDEIEKPYDEITVQIRQGERGGQANDDGEACFWSDPQAIG